MRQANASADSDKETVRVSTDTEAAVRIGEYSRHGCSRGPVPVKASDHDMMVKQKLIPGGILEILSGRAFLFFTESYKTSDFMVDGLLLWRNNRKEEPAYVKRLVINTDNGPGCGGRRTQFPNRLIEFVDKTGLIARPVYYPPYHSKYNATERYRAGPEKSRNGYLPESVNTVLNRAGNFAWKGIHAAVNLLRNVCEKGIRVCGNEKIQMEKRLKRSERLPLYSFPISIVV